VITAGAGCNQVSDHEVDCFGSLPNGIQSAAVRLRDRGDTASLVIQDSVSFSFHGKEGDDRLTLCAQCPGILGGGPGADVLHGGDLGGRFSGGRGPDILTTGEQGGVMLGGRGTDRLMGGSGKDLLKPGDGKDSAFGGPGRDTFRARDGFLDILNGGKGADSARATSAWMSPDQSAVSSRASGQPLSITSPLPASSLGVVALLLGRKS